jgi:hypothetical protein
MKILIALSVIGVLLLGIILMQDKSTERKDLGTLLLTKNEATPTQIVEIRNSGYDGLIYVPETKTLYGKTEQLEKEGININKIISEWNK